MSTLKTIKNRVSSVNNISQITNAMQMVAASKMKKAQKKTTEFQLYAEKISSAVTELSQGVDSQLHQLLSQGEPEADKLILLLTTDKGLCGALNSSLLRKVDEWYPELENLKLVTIGEKGRSFVRAHQGRLQADFSGEEPSNNISALTKYTIQGFLEGEYSQVDIIFNRFVNSFQQEPTLWQLLPIAAQTETENKKEYTDFLIEPSPLKVLEALLPEYIENRIRAASLSAEASEYSARMIAMKNATDNAEGLVEDLTLEYNKLRQTEITMSLQDITTARLAVE